MLNRFSYLLWGASYWIRTQILRQKIPFIGGMVLNESCNLSCRHCRVANRKINDHSFDEIIAGFKEFYRRGIRSVFLEGGEPFVWRDGEKTVHEAISAARTMGFRTISIYTNGTLPFDCDADTIFVSLDGLEETNNRLRGAALYATIMENIAASSHPNIIINFTINQQNHAEIEAVCNMVKNNPRLRGIFFYFHTPYYGIDELFIPLEQKQPIIANIIRLKRQYPILNSKSCLKAVAADTWKRPTETCLVYADRQMHTCCRARGNPLACENCGYLGYPEIQHILKLRPDAILSAIHYISAARRGKKQ